MVNRQVVLDTVKRMFQSGIGAGVVEKTLKDIGLSKKEAEEYMREAGQATHATASNAQEAVIDEKQPFHEAVASKTAEKIKEHLAEQREDDELKSATLHAAIEGHGEKISELHENVSDLHRKIDGFSERLTDPELLKQLVGLGKKLSDFESQLSDLKSLASANKTILEKILQTNREILNKL